MSTPFAADNARKAAAPQYAAKQPDPWSIEVRLRLSALRRNAIARGDWRGPRFSLPEPCWRVTDAHSITQQKLYLALQAIGEGRYNRPKTGAAAAIKGQKNASGKPYDYDVWVSLTALAWIAAQEAIRVGLGRDPTPLKIGTVRDGMWQLAAKHSAVPSGLRRVRGDDRRDEKGRCINREATFYRVPHWDAVLEARDLDKTIATTHHSDTAPRGVCWTNGRANSRRLLTAEEASVWGLAALPERPKRPATDAKSTHAAPVGETAPEISPQAARSTAATGAGRGSGAGGRPGPLTIINAEQLAALSALCGYSVDAKIAGEILANLEATAARHGKVFPREGLIDPNPLGTNGMCNWFFEKACRETTEKQYDQTTGHYSETKRLVWLTEVRQPAAYLRGCAAKDDDRVCDFIDQWDFAAKRDKQKAGKKSIETWEKIASCLQQLRKSPNSVSLLQWSDELQSAHPDLYIEVWREDDRRHGGDGEGASWDNTPLSIHKKPAVERTFADALAFGDPEEERPPPTESA